MTLKRKFPTSVVNDMKRNIAQQYEKHGTAEALRECYELHIRNYAGRFDPHKLAAWGRYNLALYKSLTENDRPNYEPYKSQPMNVYKELQRISDYELGKLIGALKQHEGAYKFPEDEYPTIVVYDHYDASAHSVQVNSVKLMPETGDIVVTDTNGNHYQSLDIVCGGMTDMLEEII